MKQRGKNRLASRWIHAWGWSAVLAGLALASCRPQDTGAGASAKDEGLRKIFKRGPVSVALSLDRKEITLAERLHFTIEIIAAEDYETELPKFGESLEQFGIVDQHTKPATLVEDNKIRRSRTYLLEPFLSGTYTIPPFKVRFWKKDDPAEKHELETEAIKVQVTSLLPEDLKKLAIHEIGDPVELPRSRRGKVIALSVLGAAAVAGGLWWLLRRLRSRQTEVAARLPAHERAYQQLEELIAVGLPEQGRFKQFYQRISDILRHYIENRFGLQAPEQTTEEFLGALGRDSMLRDQHKTLLRRFLKYCDLVKFAEHQPVLADVQDTFDACKCFIMETANPNRTEGTQVAASAQEAVKGRQAATAP